MPKNKTRKSPKSESDSAYVLKLVLYLIVGSQWVFISDGAMTYQVPIPVGLIVGLWFASRERFRLDRKLEYALLLVSTFIGFWANLGLLITI